MWCEEDGGEAAAVAGAAAADAHRHRPPPQTLQAFDRHCNMVLENVKEMWTEAPKSGKGAKRGARVNRDRFVPKMFLRGDSVILVLRNPK